MTSSIKAVPQGKPQNLIGMGLSGNGKFILQSDHHYSSKGMAKSNGMVPQVSVGKPYANPVVRTHSKGTYGK